MKAIDAQIARLLNNTIDPITFKNSYFNKCPLFIKGSKQNAEDILCYDEFETLIKKDDLKLNVILKDDDFEFQKKYLKSPELKAISSIDAIKLRKFGAYLIHGYIQEQSEKSSKIGAAIKEFFNIPGNLQVSAWSAVKNGGGVELHTDATGLFTVQLHGRKTWRISNKILKQGESVVRVDDDRSWEFGGRYGSKLLNYSIKDSECYDIVLEPGDLLYLPPYSWHSTTPLSEEILSINFRYTQTSILNVIKAAQTHSVENNLPRRLPNASKFYGADFIELNQLHAYKEKLVQNIENNHLSDIKDQIYRMICDFAGYQIAENGKKMAVEDLNFAVRNQNIVMKFADSRSGSSDCLFFGRNYFETPIESRNFIHQILSGNKIDTKIISPNNFEIIEKLYKCNALIAA